MYSHSWSIVVIRGHSWLLVCTFRHKTKKNRFPNPADDLISAVPSFRYMLHKKTKAIDYASSQSRDK